MDEIVAQLGGLLLGSIPNMFFLVMLYGSYSGLVHKPLVGVLVERHAKTEGAVEKARADIAAAEARTAEYEQRLREARAAVFKRLEMHRQQALQARSDAVAQARARAQARVQEAKAAIQKDKQTAQASLEAEGVRLAAVIIRTVLLSAAQVPAVGR